MLTSTSASRAGAPARLLTPGTTRASSVAGLRASRRSAAGLPVAARPTARAPAAAVPTTVRGRRALRLDVLAYSEHRDLGRERSTCGLGDRVVSSMMAILCRPASALDPPADDVRSLRGDTSGLDVRVDDGVLARESFAGADALLAWIERERARTRARTWRIVASAACPLDDAYFALLETVAPGGGVGEGREPLVLHKIIWLDVDLDDGKRCVTSLHIRGQLAPDDLSALVGADRAHRALCATPFPHDRVTPYPPGLDVEAPMGNQRRWCDARCSSNDERALLFGGGGGGGEGFDGPAIDRERYRLWDGFGCLPVLCAPERRAAPGDACVVRGEAVAEIIAGAKRRFKIDCRLQQAAVSFEKNVAFTRWLSVCEDRDGGEGFVLEGLEAVLFDDEGKLLDTWLFRDPTPGERARLLGE